MRAFRRAVWAIGGVAMLAGCGEGAAFNQGGAGQSAGGQAVAGSSSHPLPGAGSPAAGGSASGSGSGVAGSSPGGGANHAGHGGNGGTAANAGTASSGGVGGGGGAGGGVTIPTNLVFSQCRLHFGTIDSKAKANPAIIPELDFFTPSWMGQSDNFDQKYVCDEGKQGAVLGKLVPVIVAYVSAFYVKRHHGGLCDCNVNCGMVNGKPNDLCHFGSQHIQADVSAIVNVYRRYAQGYAACYGTTRPIIFEMEPDWYQYIANTQTDPMTKVEAAQIIGQYVDAIKSALPNAHFSIDVSPWADDNGVTNGKDWYSYFDLSKFTFMNTSGGNTLGASTKIRTDNLMTWAGVSQVTGKGVMADTGYGVGGVSAGHDGNWDNVDALNARLEDGVVSISQYNPKGDWANTLKGIRSQLKTPKFCP